MSSRTLRLCIAAGAFLATLAAGSAPAFGYRMIQNTTVGTVSAGYLVTCNDPGGFVHWTNSQISWYHNTAGQGSGKGTALQNAMAAWTNVANADHTLSYAGTTTAGWATDGQNTVVWASGNGCTGSCLALTALTLQSGQVIVETDVTFNSAYTWRTDGSNYDTQAVAAHEFGHTLGIHHTELTSTPRPTMYASYFGTGGRTLESDDISALQCAQSRYPFTSTTGPATPAWMSVQSQFCLGMVTLSWASSTGATYYEVEESNDSNYQYPWLIYSDSGTSIFHDGGTGTSYYRVRACDATGCSGYRDGDSPGHYYDPCW